MFRSESPRLLTVCIVLSISLPILTACNSNGGSPAASITGSQAPAPGSQEGIHSVADTDYEQIALAVDSAQVELDALASQPARKASAQVQEIAKRSAVVVGPEATTLRAKLVKDGNASVANHHSPAVSNEQVAALGKLSGAEFDAAWARAMFTLNEQVIQAAVTEMNVGEDKETRALARAKLDYASAQNGALRPLMH